MTLTPEQIRSATFEHSRRGYDPAAVERLLASVAQMIEDTNVELASVTASLADARAVEATLRSTMVAMSQAREEILDGARAEAVSILEQAEREAKRTTARAEDEGAELLMNARRDALGVIAAARCDADYLLDMAHTTAGPLLARVDQLRAVIRRTENLMRGMASGALGDLSQAHLMLDEAPHDDGLEMQIVFSEHDAEDGNEDLESVVSPLPAAVDRLLTHLREIG